MLKKVEKCGVFYIIIVKMLKNNKSRFYTYPYFVFKKIVSIIRIYENYKRRVC